MYFALYSRLQKLVLQAIAVRCLGRCPSCLRSGQAARDPGSNAPTGAPFVAIREKIRQVCCEPETFLPEEVKLPTASQFMANVNRLSIGKRYSCRLCLSAVQTFSIDPARDPSAASIRFERFAQSLLSTPGTRLIGKGEESTLWHAHVRRLVIQLQAGRFFCNLSSNGHCQQIGYGRNVCAENRNNSRIETRQVFNLFKVNDFVWHARMRKVLRATV